MAADKEIAPEVTAPAAEPKLKKALKVYPIQFHGEGGDVEIAHNFRLNVYKRNVDTTIDENFLGVLKAAVVHTVIKDADGKPKQVTIPQYHYTLGDA